MIKNSSAIMMIVQIILDKVELIYYYDVEIDTNQLTRINERAEDERIEQI